AGIEGSIRTAGGGSTIGVGAGSEWAADQSISNGSAAGDSIPRSTTAASNASSLAVSQVVNVDVAGPAPCGGPIAPAPSTRDTSWPRSIHWAASLRSGAGGGAAGTAAAPSAKEDWLDAASAADVGCDDAGAAEDLE